MKETAAHLRSPAMTAVARTGQVGTDPAGTDQVGGGSSLKLAIVGPTCPDKGGVAAHTTALAHYLAQAGHDVTLVSWSRPFPDSIPTRKYDRTVGVSEVTAFPRTIRALSWARPDTWVRTGRRLRGFDAIIVVQVMPIVVPAHLSMLRAAGAAGGIVDPGSKGGPRSIVIAHNVCSDHAAPGERALMRSLFDRVDAVLVHSPEQARLAQGLHAVRVSVATPVLTAEPVDLLRSQESDHPGDLSSPWAHYVGTMEALASPPWHVADQDSAEMSPAWSVSLRKRLVASVPQMVRRRRPTLSLTRADLPDWVRPSDVLGDGADADDARVWARSHGLPRVADPIAAWSALGALAAIVRLGDDGHRSSVIVDGSGPLSPLSQWAQAIGFVPVELDFTGKRAALAAFDVDTASLDVITRLHPNGCDSADVDEALSQASWALRSGGLISLTLPLGPAGADGAVGPADVRAILARAHDLGFVLVGDLDGEITTLMRAASEGARRRDAAYALVRLTFRRR